MRRITRSLVLNGIAVTFAIAGWLVALPGPTPTASAAGSPDATFAGDPISTLTGHYWRADSDLGQGWLNPLLQFTRYYYSGNGIKGDLGTGWMDTYDERLKQVPDGKGTIFVDWPPYGAGMIPPDPDGRYRFSTGETLTVAAQGNGASATDQNGTQWTFDAKGMPVSVKDTSGDVVTLSYCSCGLLSTVTDPTGRGTLILHYSAGGQLTSVTSSLSTTAAAAYTYDGALLHTATDGAGATTTYGYAPNSGLLTTVTDSHGTTQLTNTYDAQGRIVAQQSAASQAAGQETTLTYTSTPDGGQITTVVEPGLPNAPTFHPTRVDTYDPKGNLVKQVINFDPQSVYTVQYGLDANGHPYVVSASANYNAAPPGTTYTAPTGCQFTLGFKTLDDLIPVIVGNCVDDVSYAANGDGQQRTTNGLLVWRKADNWTAFTNGYWTWINEPGGIAKRLNTQRFPWEANPTHLPTVTTSAP